MIDYITIFIQLEIFLVVHFFSPTNVDVTDDDGILPKNELSPLVNNAIHPSNIIHGRNKRIPDPNYLNFYSEQSFLTRSTRNPWRSNGTKHRRFKTLLPKFITLFYIYPYERLYFEQKVKTFL